MAFIRKGDNKMEHITTQDMNTALEDLEDELEWFLEEDGENTEEDFDYIDKIKELREVKEELGIAWDNGVYLVEENDFKEFAEEFAKGLYGFNSNDWPFRCINWDEAAGELESDYSIIEIDDATYYYQE